MTSQFARAGSVRVHNLTLAHHLLAHLLQLGRSTHCLAELRLAQPICWGYGGSHSKSA